MAESVCGARADASYVLDWLRQSGAPLPVVMIQRRVVESLGGYVGLEQRVSAEVAAVMFR